MFYLGDMHELCHSWPISWREIFKTLATVMYYLSYVWPATLLDLSFHKYAVIYFVRIPDICFGWSLNANSGVIYTQCSCAI